MRWISAMCLVSVALGCSRNEREKASGGAFDFREPGEATLVKTLALTSRSDALDDRFERVVDILPLPDGSVWVLSTSAKFDEAKASISAFDSSGQFIRQVGASGKGPGQFMQPYGMTLMNNGKVAVRDRGMSDRIVLFETDGSPHADMIADGRTSWPTIGNFRWISGRNDGIRSDDFGVVWLPFDGHTIDTDSGTVFNAQYARVRPGGQFIDVIDSPETPVVRSASISWSKRLPGGGTEIRGVTVPHQPVGRYSWSPRGYFAVARTDKYQIDELELFVVREPDNHAPRPQPRVTRTIKRTVPRVSVDKAERDSIVSTWRREIVVFHAESLVTLPKPADTKPFISDFRYADDGRLLVWVSQPSVLVDGEWIEPQAVDVFDKSGNFTGRMVLPRDFSLVRMHGNVIWGIARKPGNGEVPERFTVRW